MDLETIQGRMLAQLEPARQSAMAAVCGWNFAIDGLVAHVTMRHRRRPGEEFLLRIAFDDFPRRAPSYVFVDRTTRELSLAGWPPNVKHGDDQLHGICTPGTREFHEKWHLNDEQYPWDPERYPVFDTLQRIHALMERGVGAP